MTQPVQPVWPMKNRPGPWCHMRHRLLAVSKPMNQLSRAITAILGAYGVVQGIVIVAGGPLRWSGPAYITANRLPGAPYSWGFAMLIFGVLILISLLLGTFTPKTIGLFGMSAWCCAFAIAGVGTAAHNPAAGNTGPASYLALTAAVALMIFVHERPPECAPSKT